MWGNSNSIIPRTCVTPWYCSVTGRCNGFLNVVEAGWLCSFSPTTFTSETSKDWWRSFLYVDLFMHIAILKQGDNDVRQKKLNTHEIVNSEHLYYYVVLKKIWLPLYILAPKHIFFLIRIPVHTLVSWYKYIGLYCHKVWEHLSDCSHL